MKCKAVPINYLQTLALIVIPAIGFLLPAICLCAQPSDASLVVSIEDRSKESLIGIGDRVRIRAYNELTLVARPDSDSLKRRRLEVNALEGTVKSISSESIVVYNRGLSKEPISFETESVRSLEVSRGRRPYWAVGLMAGLVVGVVLAASHEREESPPAEGWNIGVDFDIDLTPALYVLGGAAFGTVIGGAFSTEKWEEVPLQGIVIGNARGSGKPSLALSFSF